MNFLPIFIFCSCILTGVYSNAIPTRGSDDNCPLPERIVPCTCFNSTVTRRITAQCANFTSADKMKNIFHRNRNWNLEDLWIDQSRMSFLPAKIIENAVFQTLKVTNSSFVTLFDTTPVTTREFSLFLYDVKILRGFEWSSIAKANLLKFETKDMQIKSFGQDFKDSMSTEVKEVSFENTGVMNIKNQAFSKLTKVESFAVNGGNLKKVSRDMFPTPWIVKNLELSNQKISALPDGFFEGMPNLRHFSFKGNLLSTLSEKVFEKFVIFFLDGNPINCDCNLRWITAMTPKIPSFFGTCAEPEYLKGKDLWRLRASDFAYCH